MSTNTIIRCSMLALTCAAGVHAADAADIHVYGAAHIAATFQYDSRTGQTQVVTVAESTNLSGVWHNVQSSGDRVYASHHSEVLPDAISVDLRTNSYRVYKGEQGQSDYTDTFGETLFYLEFEVLSTIVHPVFISHGANIRLSRAEPSPASWILTDSTTLPDLTPGYYAFDALAVAGSSQAGTLYLPSPGTCAILAPMTFIAARRRR